MTVARSKIGADRPSVIAELEWELVLLVRALEAVQRRRNYPLDRAHYLLLGLLEREGPQSIAALASDLLLDGSTVTRQVTTMEDQGLVEKQPHPQDGRSTLICATPRGLREAAKMREMRLRRVKMLFQGWDAKDRATFAALLARFNASLSEVLSAPEP
jgi:DNA-binding MarR family transcriptional regulator